jgi:membrane-associated phospholipid phosphatase
MRRLSRIDRRLGARVRGTVEGVPCGARAAAVVASGMSPGFRVAVGLLVAGRDRRGTGLRALAAGVAAAVAARLLRDRLGRRRPGERQDGGFPSRHAAAAAAIAATVWRREPAIGRGLAVAAAAGGLARVATAEHEPADIVAGAALGLGVAGAVAWAADRVP